MQTPYESYNCANQTLNPSMQVIMLYDAAINYVKQAKTALAENDHDKRYSLIDKTMNIMRGLRGCLDFGANEEVAYAMDRYYDAIERLIVEVQCTPDEKLCNEIIKNLTTIRNSWRDINIKNYENSNDDELETETGKDLLV